MKTISANEFNSILANFARETDVPVTGSFELTPLCNLDCKMCYVHLQDPSVKDRMLDPKQWIAIMDRAIQHGMIKALLTGGEAMTYPGFWEIYMYLVRKGVSVQVKTNGILLSEEAIARFREYPPYMIDISLYGCNSESYVAVTGKDVFATVVRNIRALIAAGIQTRINVTPSRYMEPWTKDVIRLAESFGVHLGVNSELFEPNPGTDRHLDAFDNTPEEERQYVDLLRKMLPREFESGEERIKSRAASRPPFLEKGLLCSAGRGGFAVNWDGTMSPCLGFQRELICTDALHDGFDAAWESLNEQVRNFEAPKKCHTCKFNTFCHYCPKTHYKYAARHLCDPAVYERNEQYGGKKKQ